MIKGSKCRERKRLEIALRRQLIEDILDEHGVRDMLVGDAREKLDQGRVPWAFIHPCAAKICVTLQMRKLKDVKDAALRLDVVRALHIGIDPRRSANGRTAWSYTTIRRDLDALREDNRSARREWSQKLLAICEKWAPAKLRVRKSMSEACQPLGYEEGTNRTGS